MDACDNVEEEVNRVTIGFSELNKRITNKITDLISRTENIRNDLQNSTEEEEASAIQMLMVRDTLKAIRDIVSTIGTDHREMHGTVSRVGKAIDRNFMSDFTVTGRDDVLSTCDEIELINRIVSQHFVRHQAQDVATALATDTGVALDTPRDTIPFAELCEILSQLKEHNLEPALQFVAVNSEKLEAQGSQLEFKLHRLKLIELLKLGQGRQTDAIQYARMNFSKFGDKYEKEIQSLMGMFLFVHNGISGSPYKSFLNRELWLEIYELFMKDCCQMLGMTVASPLATCINAGCTAIPALMNIKQVMVQRQVHGLWQGKDELPIEIDLGMDGRYHSMFACPILRQQSTQNNPPMRLICGHVISKDALNKLCNGNNKMKCPYCPIEQSPADAKLIYF